MRVRWPITGASIVGILAVISYINSTPDPDFGVVIGLIAVTALVILAVLVVGLYARHVRANP